MERVFLDTNIVIDLLAKRTPFYLDAQELFSRGDRKQIELCISSLTFANAYYSISKHHRDIEVKKYMSIFKVLVTVLPLEDKSIELALAADFADFEDGLQYFTALSAGADVIISRNKKDFNKSVIPVMTAGEFLEK
jgi:predicted nucleic acid-binding protein